LYLTLGVCEHSDEGVEQTRKFLYQLDNQLCKDAEIFTFIYAKQIEDAKHLVSLLS
jgi:hypothetical protein